MQQEEEKNLLLKFGLKKARVNFMSMEELWNQVLECRRMGCEAYIEKHNKEQSLRADYKPKKPKAKKNYSFGKDYEVPLLPDSEDEATPQKGNLEMYDI